MSDRRATDPEHPIRRAFADLLGGGVVLLGGACGTELLRRGVPTPLPLWSAAALDAAPDVVREIHADHVRAGARLITANTFRTDRRTLAKAGQGGRARELTKRAVTLAREGVSRAAPREPVLIAGSIAPLEDCYRADLVPDATALRVEHAVKVGNLVAAGAPVALVETMNTVREAVAALEACAAGNLPALVSFVCRADARLLSGEDLADAARAVAPLAPLAVLVNCCPPATAERAVALLSDATDLPVGAYPNGGGRPDDGQGWSWKGGLGRWRWLRGMDRVLAAGARLVGGCCGTTPAHVAGLARRIARRPSARG
jgi:S-methylmethionine-dependent homocysteine/selenocysteine methylase